MKQRCWTTRDANFAHTNLLGKHRALQFSKTWHDITKQINLWKVHTGAQWSFLPKLAQKLNKLICPEHVVAYINWLVGWSMAGRRYFFKKIFTRNSFIIICKMNFGCFIWKSPYVSVTAWSALVWQEILTSSFKIRFLTTW